MTTPTPSDDGSTIESMFNACCFRDECRQRKIDLSAAQEARDQAIAIARELARLACCMDAPAPGSIGTQVAKLDALEARIGGAA